MGWIYNLWLKAYLGSKTEVKYKNTCCKCSLTQNRSHFQWELYCYLQTSTFVFAHVDQFKVLYVHIDSLENNTDTARPIVHFSSRFWKAEPVFILVTEPAQLDFPSNWHFTVSYSCFYEVSWDSNGLKHKCLFHYANWTRYRQHA